MEKKLHATLREAHADQVVPRPELEDRINVVSEVYRPDRLQTILTFFDRVVAKESS